jgi:hypothetical protein
MTSELMTGHALQARTFAESGAAIDATGIRSTDWRARFQAVLAHARAVLSVVLGAVAACGQPSYFELERRGPTVQRLGPGLYLESDSFWPLSDW